METSLTGKALDFGSNEYGFESRVSNIQTKPYLGFISAYNTSLKKKKQIFHVRSSYENRQVIQVLKRLGLLRFLQTPDKKFITIIPFYSKTYKLNRVTTLTYFTKNPKHVSLKALEVLTNHSPLTQLIVSTPYGLLTNQEAISKRVGGFIYFRLS